MSPDPNRIELYDATLRDGMGGGGMSLTAQEKVRVVHALDELGVHMIEAGFPASNPKEQELFGLLAGERLQVAEVVAFGMTRRRDARAEEDEGLRILAECFAPACTLVGKASVMHVEKVVRVSREENLAMIADSVAFLTGAGKRVLFDAEHFFDGFALDPGYALDCLRAAAEAGSERVVLCDTNGGCLPPQIRTAFAVVAEALPGFPLGIHTHDDSGCAVANTLTAVESGATQVQGTVNGIGERTGNANLVTIIADLQLKMGARVLADEQLARLTETAHFVDELLNRSPNPAQPYVGKHAFAHKAGLHAAGISADVQTFEHVDPAAVGNDRDVLISELSGRATVLAKAREAGISVEPAQRPGAEGAQAQDDAAGGADVTQRVIERVKELEHEGFQFEAADGSFELLMRKEAGVYEPLFRLESWRVLVEKRADGKVETEATIKIWVGGERWVRTAEGNGPVNALDNALRQALAETHPHLRDIDLVNFKVRILDETKGTGAVTRVLLDASDGHDVWGSIGVSENVIAASWDALVDSLEYGMQPGRRPPEGESASASAPPSTGTPSRPASSGDRV
jgi:2-isopropylmalate synthase